MESTKKMTADLIIIGGGVGGVAGALAAAKLGKRVIVTEETEWIGGQLTNQAVPPDEHPWIEQFGATASYREFRGRASVLPRSLSVNCSGAEKPLPQSW